MWHQLKLCKCSLAQKRTQTIQWQERQKLRTRPNLDVGSMDGTWRSNVWMIRFNLSVGDVSVAFIHAMFKVHFGRTLSCKFTPITPTPYVINASCVCWVALLLNSPGNGKLTLLRHVFPLQHQKISSSTLNLPRLSSLSRSSNNEISATCFFLSKTVVPQRTSDIRLSDGHAIWKK